jgi:hypothetical protein
MGDAREAAHEAASKLLSKGSRWRTKIFSKDEAAPKQEMKPVQSFKLDEDVSDFLKPSTQKAQSQRDANAAYQASASRPRIDISKAQRWPSAQDILKSAAAGTAGSRSPGPGGLKRGMRQKGLSVSFVRTLPEVIGHGGDECEEPAAEVSRRKKTGGESGADRLQAQKGDDGSAGSGVNRSRSHTEQRSPQPDHRNSLTRTLTSHGELSAPLDRKLELGYINSHPHAPPPPPQRMGPMGLGERPRALARAPTGFDMVQAEAAPRRPSDASAYSHESENRQSPVLAKKMSNVEPTIPEENSRPNPLQRTAAGFHEQANDVDREPVPAMHDFKPTTSAMPEELFLGTEPIRADSFAASVKQRAQAEGRAFHEAAQRQSARRDSDSSSLQSTDALRVGSPPSSYQSPQRHGRSPLQMSPGEGLRASPSRSRFPEEPQRSRAQMPSPGRRPMSPEAFSADTQARPTSSSSSLYTTPSGKSYTQTSPNMRADPFTATNVTSIHRNPSILERGQVSTAPQPSIPPPLPQHGQGASYFPKAQAGPPQLPPVYAQDPRMPPDQPSNLPIRPRQETNEVPAAQLSRSDTKMLGEVASRDFAERVTHMRGIFELMAQLGGQLYDRSPMQWLRVATWWFLRGRSAMETLIRSRPKNTEAQLERLTQPHVDLAKVWWILTEVIPGHPALQQYAGPAAGTQAERARQAGDLASSEVFEVQAAIIHYMKLLVGSMQKHHSMPPTQALIQGQDQSIWEEYPQFAPDAASVLQAGIPKTAPPAANGAPRPALGLSQSIPIADTKTDFVYFRVFVKASLSTDDPQTDRVPMSAVISIVRPRDQYPIKLAICSQSELVNIIVGSNLEGGPTWSEVTWKKPSNQISVQLRHHFTLTIDLNEGDFRSLWAIVDHTNRVQTDLRAKQDERFACKLQLREASYKDPANPSAFPPERISGCKLLVFEKVDRTTGGFGKRSMHRGYRMALVTTQQSKQVSLVNHELGTKQAPLNFEYVTEADQAPAMRLYFREEAPDKKPRVCTLYMVFQEGKDRNNVFGTFTSMNIMEGEMTFAQVPLKAFCIESADQAEGFSQRSGRVLEKLQWQEAKVVNQDPEAAGLEAAPTVMSDSLRIVCRHSAGIVSDRMNLGRSFYWYKTCKSLTLYRTWRTIGPPSYRRGS